MSALEYNDWVADYSIKPWGDELADYRVGMVTQSIRAANSKKPVMIKDCMPVFEDQKKTNYKDWKKMLGVK